jgi:hypothetical protein
MLCEPSKHSHPSRVTIPAHAHPLAKVLFSEMARQRVTYAEIEHCSGVLAATFKAWRVHSQPGLNTIEAALGALGWAVLPVPRMEHLPPKIQVGLEALAAEWEGESPLLCQLLATVSKIPIVGEFKHHTGATG